MPSSAINNFNRNISSVNDLVKIYEVIEANFPILKKESGEILRAVIVLTVSALDTFLHDFYRTEIVDVYLGKKVRNIHFEKIKINLKGMKEIDEALSSAQKENLLTSELRRIQKQDSYQSNRSIENLFSTLDVKNIWSKLEIFGINGLKSSEIKQELAIIIDRRNKISHESDWDYVNEKKFPIELLDVNSVLDFVIKFVTGINTIST